MLVPVLLAGALVGLAPPPGGFTPTVTLPASTPVDPPATAPASADTRRQSTDDPPSAAAKTRRGARGKRSQRQQGRRPPWSWRFVGAHYGTGVMASLLVLPGSYALAGWVGHRGNGLAPVVGSMLIGALVPSPVIYTTQWAVGRRLYPRRERLWPGLLVHQATHLAVFAGAVMGGASFREFRHAAPIVLADALGTTALASLTAEATRRHRPAPPPVLPELSWQRHDRLWKPRGGITIIVPIVKVRLP
jgi:hypothetical protein